MKTTEAVKANKATGFILTKEYGRFAEFADSCSEFGYIGICHGEPGVGKSLAAAYYSKWDEEIGRENAVSPVAPALSKKLKACRGVLLSAPVINTPKIIEKTVSYRLDGYSCALSKARGEKELLKIVLSQNLCPLVLIDEADRLNINSLEQLRHMYDESGFALVLIGMPGIEKRLSRYPQLYSRIGFSHEFCALSPDEMRFIFERKWSDFGLEFSPEHFPDVEALNTVIRITGGNFRLIERLFSQVKRILRINSMKSITKEVVEAARECLVIGRTH